MFEEKNQKNGSTVQQPSAALSCAVLSDSPPGTAVTNTAMYLAAGLAEAGHRVDFLGTIDRKTLMNRYGDIPGARQVSIVQLGIEQKRGGTLFTLWQFVRLVNAIRNYLKDKQPQLVFSQLIIANVTLAIARRLQRSPGAHVMIEGTMISHSAEIASRENPWIRTYPWMVRRFYPWADGVVGKSPDVVEDLQSLLSGRPAPPMRWIPNPYPLERFVKRSRNEAELPWEDSADEVVFVTTGRLARQKGHTPLLKAFAEVQKQLDARLLIIGRGPIEDELMALADELGVTQAVHFLGYKYNPLKFMRRCDVFVLASLWEGWPSALMEAMAIGLPVITTDCPGGGKLAVTDGDSGLVVPSDNVEALRDAMLLLATDEDTRARYAERAQQQVAQFDFRKVSKDYLRFALESTG